MPALGSISTAPSSTGIGCDRIAMSSSTKASATSAPSRRSTANSLPPIRAALARIFKACGIEAEIVAADPKAKSINQAGGGYGAGYNAAAERHRQVREWMGALAYEQGMNVVFIGHADTETLDLPDMDAFGRYTVRMHKKSIPHYTDNVDLVAFIRLKTFTRGDGDKKRAISTGEREIICYPQASSVTKNRFRVTQPIAFTFDGGNPFNEFVAK